MSEERIETWCVIPMVRNSAPKAKHRATLWGHFRAEIYEAIGGVSGPTSVMIEPAAHVMEGYEPVPGGWRNPKTGREETDLSRKYTMIVERSRVDALRSVLERAANSFDQEEILFLVQGADRSVKRDPTKGFLKGDPAGG